jgi:tetratricopeptide (TPR) repeat protein/KaiC/GvpD/RAD55 family RecA-like ATPase
MLNVGILTPPILVGREHELEDLQLCLDAVIAGKGRTVFVSGEAGTGKTRLTTEFLRIANKKGVMIMSGGCLGNVSVPYFPFIEAFETYFDTNADVESEDVSLPLGNQPSFSNNAQLGNRIGKLATWLSGPKPVERFGKPAEMSPQVWRDQTFIAIAKTLHSMSCEHPLILFLEDIHWADSASLGLLHYISKVIGLEPIMILATFRSEELNVDNEGHPHPLVEALQLMRRESLFKEVKLQGLDNQNINKVAENLMNGKLDPQLAKKLSEESQGNPLFIVESLRMLQERKSLFQENNQWRLLVDELGIPSKIKEIILRRLGTLKLSQRRVLDAASVIGEKFDVELLSSVLKQDSLEVLEALNFVAQSTSLVLCEKDYFKFDHAKSREILYEEIPLPLKKGYHSRVAEKLEASAKSGKMQLSEIAYHYTRSGNQEKALTYSAVAGREALERFSNSEAIAHFKYILQTIGEASENINEKLVALDGLGDAYHANSSFREAIRTFETLANLATGIAKTRAYGKIFAATFALGDYTNIIERVKKAEEVPIIDRLEKARIGFAKGCSLLFESKPTEAMKFCEEAIQIMEEEYALWDLTSGLSMLGAWYCFNDQLEQGVGTLLRSIELSGDLEDYRLQAISYQTAGQFIHVNCGYPEEAAKMLVKSIQIAEKIANYNKLAEAYCVLSWTYEAKGQMIEAIEKGHKAEEYIEKTDSNRIKAMVFSCLTRQYLQIGDLENAEKYFNKLMSIPKEALFVPGPQAFQTMAMFYAAKGQWKESNECFNKQAELLKNLTPGARITFNKNYAWALEKQGHYDEAKKIREKAKAGKEVLEARFEHVNLQVKFAVPINVIVGQEFEARLDIVNPSRGKGTIVRIEKLITPEFKILKLTPECNINCDSIEIKEIALEPFSSKSIKITLKTTKTGTFNLAPQVFFVDDIGQTRTITSTLFTVTSKQTKPDYESLPDRLPTGTPELDRLLLGGIPLNSAVVLGSSSCNERDQIVKNFIESGLQSNEATIYLSCNANNVSNLIKEKKSNLSCLVCNNQAESMFLDLLNVFKLRGVDNLTEIDISLTKILRTFNLEQALPKRACIDLISDALLQHGAVISRKWLSNLLPVLKSKGFTTLAIVDEGMHRPEELQAIVSLFDGQIKITQRVTDKGENKVLRIERLSGNKFLAKDLQLSKEGYSARA